MSSNYLTYSPSCEVYIETTTADRTKKYYDVSQDITNMTIRRVTDDSSTFSITLANKNRKYNGLFSSMDRIVIYATKTDKIKLLTGYITDVDVFTLYAGNFHISGRCSIYYLQQHYWDPSLIASAQTINGVYEEADSILASAALAQTLLVNVGAWGQDKVIMGGIPGSVVAWATDMYLAQKNDIKQAEEAVEKFFDILHTHSNQIGSGYVDVEEGGTNSAAKNAKPVGGSHKDGAKYHQTQGNGVCCGATSFTIALNMMLGLKGGNAYQNLSVWSSSAFGSNSTIQMAEKGSAFLRNEGLSNKLTFTYYPGEITKPAQIKEVLKKGQVIVVSSGGASNFLNADGSTPRNYEGHFIMFYNYSGGTYYANDPAVDSGRGAGIPYSESDLAQWIGGRSYHTPVVMAIKGK